MNTLLRSLISGQPVAEEYGVLPTHCKDPLGFTWWLVTHLAELGQYSRNGAFQNEVIYLRLGGYKEGCPKL